MEDIQNLQGMMAQLLAMQQQSVDIMNRLLTMAESKQEMGRWCSPSQAAELTKIVGEKALKNMANDGRFTYGKEFIQDDGGNYRFRPDLVLNYFLTHPSERGGDAIAA